MKGRWEIAQAAEIRWWKNYLSNKSIPEYLQWKKQYWQSFIQNIDLVINKSDQIIDLGCGPAGIYMIFPDNQITAVDPLINQYESHINHFSIQNYPNVDFINIPMEEYETDNKYDLIFCLNAINHVRDINSSMEKLIDLMAPKSKLVLSIDAHNYILLKQLFRLIPGDILHPHQYDLNEYQSMLNQRDLTIKTINRIKKGFIFDYYVLVAER